MECTHLLDNIKAISEPFEDTKLTKNFECSECKVKEQNWVCLQCGVVNCGRYINSHAKLHAESSDHQICMSCDIFSVYCYKCDDYVSNDTEERTIDKFREIVKNNVEIESEAPAGTEFKHIDEDETSSELVSNAELIVEGPDIGPILEEKEENIDADEELNRDIEDENKIKNKIVDETGRSLRPRSRKRSHSGDSSSTENSSQTARLKEKKYTQNGKSQREKKVVGLKNLGNTCFMNAVLQSLSNIQEFSCYFNSLPSLELKSNGRKVYHSRSITRQEMHDVLMAEELRKVLINLNKGSGAKGAISPECLFLVIWKVVPRFRGYQQQDAHEFLRYMLDRLHQELLQLLPQEGKDSSYVTALRTGSASIVTALFGGTLQSEVRCLACGTDSKKFDPFLDLSLELPETVRQDATVLLSDCLASFVQVEELADTERYFCSSCKCKQKSTKQFWIRRLPNVLCLHLKRFRWNNYFRTKVDTNITFPITDLDMTQFVLSNLPETRRSGLGNNLYDLAAVIVHHGSGAGSGHYTAFAINEDQWFHFNDQTVRAADAETVAACKPYILFYIRRELSLPVTTPS